MKKIGIMGGTFNPIHNAHIMMAQAAYEQYHLDEVWFMPSKNPPHKEKDNIVSEEHRTRMVQFAIDGMKHFIFSDMELKREGTTYTSDTLAEVHEQLPEAELYFILGGDSLEGLVHWHEPEKILKQCIILAAPRGNIGAGEMKEICQTQGKKLQGTILPIKMNHIQISSEQIRKRLKKGKSVAAYCPEKVRNYIHLHGLYDSTIMKYKAKKLDKNLLEVLASTLRPKRLAHTMGVAYTATSLAFCHGADAGKAELAGLLHDCAKYYTGEELRTLCEKHNIELSPVECTNTALIHAKFGAWLAKERYGIQDEEILSAIFCHTTGKPNMTILEKIIYAADYIEPGRHMECKPHALEKIRRECFQNLDRGICMISENVVCYLRQLDMAVDETSMRTYEYYKSLLEKNREGRG